MGVLSVLARAGIPIDCVAGTSAGALLGALYCAGLDLSEIERAASRIGWRDVARPVWPRQAFVTFSPMERWLINLIGDRSFDDLPVPFVAVATDLDVGEPVVLRQGRLAPAVRASSSVPGLVTPVVLAGHVLGDGGISDNLPVSSARELGADFVIGVNLFVPSIHRRTSPLSMGFRAVETLVRRAGGGLHLADCLISPDLGHYSYFRFSRQQELILAGKAAAEAALPAIRAALEGRTRSSRQDEPSPVPGHGTVEPAA